MLNFEFDWPTNHKNVRIRFNAKNLSCEWIVDENIIFLLKFTEQHKKRKLLFMPDNLKTLEVYKHMYHHIEWWQFQSFLIFQQDNAHLHKARVIANCVKDVNVLL
jgi:hypothetical protein